MVNVYISKDLRPVLMEADKAGVKEAYYIIRGDSGENITVVSPGKNGPEYNKTFGYFNAYPEIILLSCLYGHGVVVIQRNGQDNEAKEVRIVGLRPGSVIDIPSGSGFCLVNTSKSYLAVLDNALSDKHQDTKPLIGKRGFVYYVVEKKGEVAIEKNVNYSFHPEITT